MIDNPVFRRELLGRIRMRQSPLPTRVGIGLATLVILGVVYYYAIGALLEPEQNAGRDTWSALVAIQYLLIYFIAPAITCNTITREKEQQTWEMLVFTPLSPGEILLGKLVARLLTVLLILLLFLPIALFSWTQAASSPNAHITPGQFFLTYLTMIISALFFATCGMFLSWLFKRTLYAIMGVYTLIVGGLTISTLLVTLALAQLFSDDRFVDKCPLIWINPVFLIHAAMDPTSQPDTGLYLIFGLLCYVVLTILMLFSMIVGFRRYARGE